MSPGTINENKALQQWESLVDVYKKLGITVNVIDQQPGVPDMVFATDEAIVREKKILLSHFWHRERQKETKHYEKWFRDHDYSITYLPADIYFEGNGNAFFWNNLIFIGVGYRANQKTCKAIEKMFDRKVIPLQIIDPFFYHLDTCLLPLNEQTVFYYPAAFSKASQNILKKEIPQLLELSREEAMGFCANSVVTDHHVVHQKGIRTFKEKLNKLGYTSVEVDLSEFKKSGGGTHCLTNILEVVN
jgi:N-dimethylarginine dimethylaminohydrolase